MELYHFSLKQEKLWFSDMLSVPRPSSEVVKEGRIFLTEKMSWKLSSPLQEHHLRNNDVDESHIDVCKLLH
jgi:hypothetical protein